MQRDNQDFSDICRARQGHVKLAGYVSCSYIARRTTLPTRAHPSVAGVHYPQCTNISTHENASFVGGECTLYVWKRRCADVRAGTQAPPLPFLMWLRVIKLPKNSSPRHKYKCIVVANSSPHHKHKYIVVANSSPRHKHKCIVVANSLPHHKHECIVVANSSPRHKHECIVVANSSPRHKHKCIVVANSSPHHKHKCIVVANSSLHHKYECIVVAS